MAEEFTDFPIEFHVEPELSEQAEDALYEMTEKQLRDLAKGHTDITNGAVHIKQPARNEGSPHIFEVNVTLAVRPNNIAATEKQSDPAAALRSALKAVERQVREQRDRLRDH